MEERLLLTPTVWGTGVATAGPLHCCRWSLRCVEMGVGGQGRQLAPTPAGDSFPPVRGQGRFSGSSRLACREEGQTQAGRRGKRTEKGAHLWERDTEGRSTGSKGQARARGTVWWGNTLIKGKNEMTAELQGGRGEGMTWNYNGLGHTHLAPSLTCFSGSVTPCPLLWQVGSRRENEEGDQGGGWGWGRETRCACVSGVLQTKLLSKCQPAPAWPICIFHAVLFEAG